MSADQFQIIHINELVDKEKADSSSYRAIFDCGKASLNDYLQKYARKNSEQEIGQTWVLWHEESKSVAGYYTLLTTSVERQETQIKAPYPIISAIKIGRLAVSLKFQRQGIGIRLLLSSFSDILEIADRVGVTLILVDAIDEEAKRFYLKNDFTAFRDNDTALFMKVEYARKLNLK